MKTFKEFCSQLDESSLSRIKSKSDKGGMAIISGSRDGKSSKENKARAKQLDHKAVLELDKYLRKLDVFDPAKYDFALFGIGVNEKL